MTNRRIMWTLHIWKITVDAFSLFDFNEVKLYLRILHRNSTWHDLMTHRFREQMRTRWPRYITTAWEAQANVQNTGGGGIFRLKGYLCVCSVKNRMSARMIVCVCVCAAGIPKWVTCLSRSTLQNKTTYRPSLQLWSLVSRINGRHDCGDTIFNSQHELLPRYGEEEWKDKEKGGWARRWEKDLLRKNNKGREIKGNGEH